MRVLPYFAPYKNSSLLFLLQNSYQNILMVLVLTDNKSLFQALYGI